MKKIYLLLSVVVFSISIDLAQNQTSEITPLKEAKTQTSSVNQITDRPIVTLKQAPVNGRVDFGTH